MRRGDETRERLLAAIQGEPGINKVDLCEKTGLAWGTVFRHIKLLEERGEARTQELAGDLDMSRKVVRRYLRMLCRAGLLRQSGDYHPRYEPVEPDVGEPDVS